MSSERRECEGFCECGGVVRRGGEWLPSEAEVARLMAFGMTAGVLSTEDEADAYSNSDAGECPVLVSRSLRLGELEDGRAFMGGSTLVMGVVSNEVDALALMT